MIRHWTAALLMTAAALGCSSNNSTGDTVTYTVDVVSAPPASAVAGTAIPISFRVNKSVNGGTAAPANGITVTFTVTAGGGSVGGGSTSTVTSGADGVVAVTWTLGSTVGTQTLRGSTSASVYSDVSVTATAVVLPAVELGFVTAPAASVQTGEPLAPQPVVQLRNANHGAVAQSGVVVTASLGSGTGTLAGATATTDASGNAAFSGLAISGSGGAYTLRFAANVGGQTLAVTSGTIQVVAPSLTLRTAPSSSPLTGVPLFVQPVIQLTDGSGNNVARAGVVVTASIGSGGSTIGVPSGSAFTLAATTDANGVAAFHDLLLTGASNNTLAFAAPGFAPVTSGTVSVNGNASMTTLANSTPLGPFIGNAGDLKYYTFQVPVGTVSMDFATYSGSGNVELYVRKGTPPTTADFDCRMAVAGASQQCATPANPSGLYYVAVNNLTAVSGNRFRVYAYNALCAHAPISIGSPLAGVLMESTACTTEQDRLINNRYTLTVPTTQALTITANSNSNVNTLFVAFHQLGSQWTYYTPFGADPASSDPILVAAGTYEVMVGDGAGNDETRTYNVLFSATPSNPTTCKALQLPSNALTIDLLLTTADCIGSTNSTRSQRLVIILAAGQTVTATMGSTQFDPVLKILADGDLTVTPNILAMDDNSGGGTTATVSYTNTDPTNNEEFTIETTSALPNGLGAYTLSVNVSPAYYNLRARAATAPSAATMPRNAPAGPRMGRLLNYPY